MALLYRFSILPLLSLVTTLIMTVMAIPVLVMKVIIREEACGLRYLDGLKNLLQTLFPLATVAMVQAA
jgi:hypothetical protein